MTEDVECIVHIALRIKRYVFWIVISNGVTSIHFSVMDNDKVFYGSCPRFFSTMLSCLGMC